MHMVCLHIREGTIIPERCLRALEQHMLRFRCLAYFSKTLLNCTLYTSQQHDSVEEESKLACLDSRLVTHWEHSAHHETKRRPQTAEILCQATSFYSQNYNNWSSQFLIIYRLLFNYVVMEHSGKHATFLQCVAGIKFQNEKISV